MREVKTTLKRMGFYYLLLAINVIPCAMMPDVFPLRNFSTIYLLALSIILVLYYSHRVSPSGSLQFCMKSLSFMGLLLILLRGIKYSAVSEVGVLARHTWYLYYVPILLLPLFLFYVAILVSPEEKGRINKAWHITLALTVVLILLILTNDLHQQAFKFAPDFAGWDSDYSHGWLFYVVNAWQFGLYVAALVILVVKCRVGDAKRNAWLLLIPFIIGIVMYALLFVGKVPKINGVNVFEFPEAHIFTAAAVLECCMCLGLIPTNTDYGKLFGNLSISAQIIDLKGVPVYASARATRLTSRQIKSSDGARIAEHTVLHKMEIPGGYGFWQDDVSEIDRINEELAEAKEGLAQEAELIRLKNELKEKQLKIEQRTLVYDAIAKRTQRQSQAISDFAKAARQTDDPKLKNAYLKRITLLGAYIKRYANLMLLSEESDVIEAGELGLSVSEVLRYLNFANIPGEIISGADCTVNASSSLAVFEAFEILIEDNFERLKGVFVNLSAKEKVVFKLTFENLSESLSSDMINSLKSLGVATDVKREDDVTYICFTMDKGGCAL